VVRIFWRRPAPGERGSEDFAWACLVANLVGIPGLGTLMARQTGAVAQLTLAIAAGISLTWWLAAFVLAEIRTMELPPPGGPPLALLLWGVVLFALAWIWALVSSLSLLRTARVATANPRPSTTRGR
jgi:hypothetical protein